MVFLPIVSMRKKSSSESVIRFGSKYSQSEHLLIQNAYRNKDWLIIKNITGSTSNNPNTLLSYGRLSNQYINIVQTPNRTEQKLFADKHSVVMGKNPIQNIQQIDVIYSSKKIGVPKSPTIKKIPPSKIPNVFRSLVPKGFKGINKPNAVGPVFKVEKINPSRKDIINELNINNLSQQQINNLQSYGCNQMRVFIKLTTNLGSIFVSTKMLNLNNPVKIKKFLDRYDIGQNMTFTTTQYYDGSSGQQIGISNEKILSIDSIYAEYYA